MRREQILKICLNHALTSDIEYKPKDTKSWHFVANDFSEGELEVDQFCIRFKTEDIAKDFKKAIDDALAGEGATQNGQTDSSATNQSSDESRKIADLKLPANFYDYKNNAECKGCRGCNVDDFVFPEVKDTNFGQIDDNSIPLTLSMASLPTTTMTSNLPKEEAVKPFSFGSPFSFANALGSKPDVTVTAAATTNNTSSTGMFFGNSSFKLNSSQTNTTNTIDVKPTPAFSFGKPSTGTIFGGGITSTSDEPAKTTSSFSFTNTFKQNSKYFLFFIVGDFFDFK